jgi:CO/xanthine dehydrogenase FAD-binding subunit
MRPLSYARAIDIHDAVGSVSADPTSAFLAGGTTEIDLVRLGVVHPDCSLTSTTFHSPRSRISPTAACASAPLLA